MNERPQSTQSGHAGKGSQRVYPCYAAGSMIGAILPIYT